MLRDQLQEERDRLRRAARASSVGGPRGDLDFDENFADSGQVTAERGEIEALAGSSARRSRDIEDALRQVRRRAPTACASRASSRSPRPRLEAMPAARLCIACASQRR